MKHELKAGGTDSGSEQSPAPSISGQKNKKKNKKKEEQRIMSDCEMKLADKMKRKKKEGKNGGRLINKKDMQKMEELVK